MEASGAGAAGAPYSPIYVSSDEDDVQIYFASSHSPDLIQMQEAILLSLDCSRAPVPGPFSVSISSSASATPSSSLPSGVPTAQESPPDCKGKRKLSPEEDSSPGDSKKKRAKRRRRRKRKPFTCGVCNEKAHYSQKFLVSHCAHVFCNGCVGRHVAAKIVENEAVVKCPNPKCKEGLVQMDLCRDIIPPELLDRWSAALREREDAAGDGFYCGICMDTVHLGELFPIDGCTHTFCAGCVGQHVAAKVEENVLSVGCPDPACEGGALHPEECRGVIPPQVFHRWGAALCDEAVGVLKFYCPFKDCSALLVDDPGHGEAAAVTDVECPHCRRTFCAQCKVPWHDGTSCEEFQRLGEDERGREDLLLRKVAQERKWQRCPKCKMYVERTSGCAFIRCRCGYCFCYNCASPMSMQSHVCTKCRH
ncbi:hypothetical protein ACP70R_006844 [Stipagrostis hirtigluma subsp. patula]